MSYTTKTPTIKRILKEATELATSPSADFTASPLETDLFEWHFTLRGPPAPSPFENGLYHGRIILPPAYPLKPPSFRFTTPSGRFEVNREICLSISGHHEETWQPAWGIRTALVAIRSFMDTSAGGQLGGVEASKEVRRRLAVQSAEWRCGVCGRSNGEIMKGLEKEVEEAGREGVQEEKVPEELRLGYREDLGKGAESSKGASAEGEGAKVEASGAEILSQQNTLTARVGQPLSTTTAPVATQMQQRPAAPPLPQAAEIPAWIDKAIYGLTAALLFLLWKKLMTWIG